MAKTKISEFNANPALNTDIDSINIAEGCAPSGINDAIRELMSQLKDWQAGTSNDPMVIGSSGSLTLNQGTANGVAYLNGSKVVTSGSALTFDGTNLGVGTTSPAAKLGVAGNIFISGASSYIAFDATQSGSTPAFIQYASNSLVFGAGSSEQMRLTSTGLGIGTSSPAEKLDVYGVAVIHNNTTSANTIAASLSLSNKGGTGASSSAGARVVAVSGSPNWYNNTSLAFYTNTGPDVTASDSTEKMRLDGSGNLGLGVTPKTWGSYFKAMQMGDYAAFANDVSTASAIVASNAYNNDNTNWRYSNSSVAAARYEATLGAHKWYTAPSGTAGNAITFTQTMSLTASGELLINRTSASGLGKLNVEGGADFTNGNVLIGRDSGNLGVGTTSPSRKLSVYSTSSIPVRFETNTSDTKIEILTTSGTQFIQGSANNLLFGTNNTEAARIDSSGRLNVGATSFGFASRAGFRGDSTSVPTVEIQNESATGTMLTFRTNGEAQVGSITFTNTAVAYNTSSDYRLKNSVAPMTGALAKVALLKPCTYKWNADGSDGEGFIAHELAEVIPQCVTGEKDAVDENGNPKYQGIDTSFLVATLTAAIQELKAEFDAYKASHP